MPGRGKTGLGVTHHVPGDIQDLRVRKGKARERNRYLEESSELPPVEAVHLYRELIVRLTSGVTSKAAYVTGRGHEKTHRARPGERHKKNIQHTEAEAGPPCRAQVSPRLAG